MRWLCGWCSDDVDALDRLCGLRWQRRLTDSERRRLCLVRRKRPSSATGSGRLCKLRRKSSDPDPVCSSHERRLCKLRSQCDERLVLQPDGARPSQSGSRAASGRQSRSDAGSGPRKQRDRFRRPDPEDSLGASATVIATRRRNSSPTRSTQTAHESHNTPAHSPVCFLLRGSKTGYVRWPSAVLNKAVILHSKIASPSP